VQRGHEGPGADCFRVTKHSAAVIRSTRAPRRSSLNAGRRLSSRCRQVAVTLLQSTAQDGTRGTGAGSTFSCDYKAMRAKFAPRMGFEEHRPVEFDSRPCEARTLGRALSYADHSWCSNRGARICCAAWH
jgi:hypothetical protein